jgi:hypothetical protein
MIYDPKSAAIHSEIDPDWCIMHNFIQSGGPDLLKPIFEKQNSYWKAMPIRQYHISKFYDISSEKAHVKMEHGDN